MEDSRSTVPNQHLEDYEGEREGGGAFGGIRNGTVPKEIFSPNEDGNQDNPVGILQELCMSRRWPLPVYNLSLERGKPHKRSFTLICVVGQNRETGTAKTKNLAKRQAAQKMMKRLQQLPRENQNMDDDDLAQGISMRHSQLKQANTRTTNGSNSQVTKFLTNLQSSIQNLSLSETVDQVGLLAKIGAEQKFTIVYAEIEDCSTNGRYECLVQLSTQPILVCPGSGDSPQGAQQSAAKSALDYLRIITKNAMLNTMSM